MIKLKICLPGNNFSDMFFDSWNKFIGHLDSTKAFDYEIIRVSSKNVFEVRNACLKGNPKLGKNQKPFGGEKYDYIFWLDSDIVFNVNQFYQLLYHDKPIVCGSYLMHDKQNTTNVERWDVKFFREFGVFPFMSYEEVQVRGFLEYFKNQNLKNKDVCIDDISLEDKFDISKKCISAHPGSREYCENRFKLKIPEVETKAISITPREGLFPVTYAGFGFMVMRYGVMEELEYPWFNAIFHTIQTTYDFSSEDVSVCLKLKEKNIPVLLDPSIKVGHVKNFII